MLLPKPLLGKVAKLLSLSLNAIADSKSLLPLAVNVELMYEKLTTDVP